MPVGVLGSPVDGVDGLAADPEGNPQLDDLADLTLVGLDAFEGGVHAYLVTGAYCREFLSVGSNDVDDASSSDPADEGAPRLLVDLTPGSFGDGGQLSMQIVHTRPFRFPIPRDPSDGAAVEPAPLL